jgi:hypothetical protein
MIASSAHGQGDDRYGPGGKHLHHVPRRHPDEVLLDIDDQDKLRTPSVTQRVWVLHAAAADGDRRFPTRTDLSGSLLGHSSGLCHGAPGRRITAEPDSRRLRKA